MAGWSGTLTERYKNPSSPGGRGAGVVRAKTGTVRNTDTLAGIVVDADGRLLAFALLADHVQGSDDAARAALDKIAETLAGCGCK